MASAADIRVIDKNSALFIVRSPHSKTNSPIECTRTLHYSFRHGQECKSAGCIVFHWCCDYQATAAGEHDKSGSIEGGARAAALVTRGAGETCQSGTADDLPN